MIIRASIFSIAALILLPFAVAHGQTAEGAKPYVPSLGDFMGMTQLRHFKLWYASRSRNWDLVNYEIGQIHDSFEIARTYYPKLGDVDLAKMIETESYAPLDALKEAAAAKDIKKFTAEFDKLTAACNACHQTAHFGFIRVNVPTASPFSNQSFAPGAN